MAMEKGDLQPGCWAVCGNRGHSAGTPGLTLLSRTADTLSLEAAANNSLSELAWTPVTEFPYSY